jgi:hypothetical protein
MQSSWTQPLMNRFDSILRSLSLRRFASGTFVAANYLAILLSVASSTLSVHAASVPAKVVIAHAGMNACTADAV